MSAWIRYLNWAALWFIGIVYGMAVAITSFILLFSNPLAEQVAIAALFIGGLASHMTIRGRHAFIRQAVFPFAIGIGTGFGLITHNALTGVGAGVATLTVGFIGIHIVGRYFLMSRSKKR